MTFRTAAIILAEAAFITLILTVVFVILLITAPKEKRAKMEKVKIALCISIIVMIISVLLIPQALYEMLQTGYLFYEYF